jgi:predicted DNA binding CopG/RHH family protein
MADTDKMTGINILLPDAVHRRLKAAASLKGIPLKEYLVEVLTAAAKLSNRTAA